MGIIRLCERATCPTLLICGDTLTVADANDLLTLSQRLAGTAESSITMSGNVAFGNSERIICGLRVGTWSDETVVSAYHPFRLSAETIAFELHYQCRVRAQNDNPGNSDPLLRWNYGKVDFELVSSKKDTLLIHSAYPIDWNQNNPDSKPNDGLSVPVIGNTILRRTARFVIHRAWGERLNSESTCYLKISYSFPRPTGSAINITAGSWEGIENVTLRMFRDLTVK